jgi:3-deoxy-7-phosphoheptulonate synthase
MESREKLLQTDKGFNNNRIEYFEELITPVDLHSLVPNNFYCQKKIDNSRTIVENIINNKDKRFLMIIGPCSIHNILQAKEYASELNRLLEKYKDKIYVVMRVYFEKPRTTTGWKGFINDPDLNNTFNVNKGLKEARLLLLYLASLGLPVACEILDPITAQYISDLVTWGAIGARTTESQTHRQMVSGLSFPVGFKNGTSGNIDIAADAMCSARYNHCFMGITDEGKPTICRTRGNPNTHIILRGGKNSPNYNKKSIKNAEEILKDKGEPKRIMVDCSHGNSSKNYKNQFSVLKDIISQIKEGNQSIFGVMIESNLNEGKQKLPNNVESLSVKDVSNQLKYGVSITDCCVSIQETEEMLDFVYANI